MDPSFTGNWLLLEKDFTCKYSPVVRAPRRCVPRRTGGTSRDGDRKRLPAGMRLSRSRTANIYIVVSVHAPPPPRNRSTVLYGTCRNRTENIGRIASESVLAIATGNLQLLFVVFFFFCPWYSFTISRNLFAKNTISHTQIYVFVFVHNTILFRLIFKLKLILIIFSKTVPSSAAIRVRRRFRLII